MKKILIFIALCTILLCSCGFDPENYPWALTESDTVPFEGGGYSFEIVEGTVRPTGCSGVLTKTDDADGFIMCGTEVTVEIYGDGKWYKIEPMYIIGTGGGKTVSVQYPRLEQDYDWTSIYGELPAGKYRIVKNFYLMGGDVMDEPEIISKDNKFCVEFKID